MAARNQFDAFSLSAPSCRAESSMCSPIKSSTLKLLACKPCIEPPTAASLILGRLDRLLGTRVSLAFQCAPCVDSGTHSGYNQPTSSLSVNISCTYALNSIDRSIMLEASISSQFGSRRISHHVPPYVTSVDLKPPRNRNTPIFVPGNRRIN